MKFRVVLIIFFVLDVSNIYKFFMIVFSNEELMEVVDSNILKLIIMFW